MHQKEHFGNTVDQGVKVLLRQPKKGSVVLASAKVGVHAAGFKLGWFSSVC